jgi:hypothetical protein
MNARIDRARHLVVDFTDYDFARAAVIREWGDDALIL